jgi:hypothetical protein
VERGGIGNVIVTMWRRRHPARRQRIGAFAESRRMGSTARSIFAFGISAQPVDATQALNSSVATDPARHFVTGNLRIAEPTTAADHVDWHVRESFSVSKLFRTRPYI